MLQRHGVYLRLTLDLMHEQWEPRWPTEVEVRTRKFAYLSRPMAWAELENYEQCNIPSAEDGAHFLASLPPVRRSCRRSKSHVLEEATSQQIFAEQSLSDKSLKGIHKVPTEVMDMIITHAVVKEGMQDIKVTPEPHLSRVSKSLQRKEVLQIFYSKNKWWITVDNYDYSVMIPIAGLNKNFGPIQLQVLQDLTEHHDFLAPRLLGWLEMFFNDQIVGLGKADYEWHVRADRLAHLFSFSRFLRDDRGLDWPTARLYLEWFIKVAGVCNEPRTDRLDGDG